MMMGKNRRMRKAYKIIGKQANRDADSLLYENQRSGQPDTGNEADPLFRARVSNIGAKERAKKRMVDLSYLNQGNDPKKDKGRFKDYKYN